ncbi:hypothetical protein [Nocardia mexicana]|uniref:Uncharacterized protein n=1 Tax=Nocardia mexicana TaxID=279262 RepID=A0A370GQV4_9NOCA|nr:hypothetical protein [Nocardia mexicana]RDI44864.1 hypothetical protein DFR68_11516 [Nocardia mexicana]
MMNIVKSVVLHHLVRGLIMLGAVACGSAEIFHAEYRQRHQPLPEPDWSIPHQWYDAAHRSG